MLGCNWHVFKFDFGIITAACVLFVQFDWTMCIVCVFEENKKQSENKGSVGYSWLVHPPTGMSDQNFVHDQVIHQTQKNCGVTFVFLLGIFILSISLIYQLWWHYHVPKPLQHCNQPTTVDSLANFAKILKTDAISCFSFLSTFGTWGE